MLVARKTDTGFDIVNRDDVNTSIVRNANMVRLSWSENGALYQLRKNTPATISLGTSLVTKGNYFMPTGDAGIAKLISLDVIKTKQVTVNGVNYTANLMACQL